MKLLIIAIVIFAATLKTIENANIARILKEMVKRGHNVDVVVH